MTIVAAIFAGVLQRVVEMLPEFYCSWSLVTLDILVWLAQFLGFFLNSVCLPVSCILSCAFDSLLGAFWLIFFYRFYSLWCCLFHFAYLYVWSVILPHFLSRL